MKNIKITKEQNEYIKEAVSLTVNTGATNGNIQQAVQNTKNDAMKSGINPNKVAYNIPAKESIEYTKKQIEEAKLKKVLNKSKKFTKKEISEMFEKKISKN